MLTTINAEFKDIDIDDLELLNSFLKQYNQTLSQYTPFSLYTWQKAHKYRYWQLSDSCIIISADDNRRFLKPIGSFTNEDQKKLLQFLNNLTESFHLFAIDQEFIDNYPNFIKHFKVADNRDYCNYLYSAKEHAELTGKKFAKKRNLITQAEALYKWNIYDLDTSHIEECLNLVEKVARNDGDYISVKSALNSFANLPLSGTVIKIDDKIEAFSIIGELNRKTSDIAFEKANKEFKGLYQILNQETASKILASGYEYINREEDLGLAGLRQNKNSYSPIELVNSYELRLEN